MFNPAAVSRILIDAGLNEEQATSATEAVRQNVEQDGSATQKVLVCLAIASISVLIMIAWFLFDSILWFRTETSDLFTDDNLIFQMNVHHLHVSMVKRSIGLLSGFSLTFLGLGVSFYHARSQSRYSVGVANSFSVEAVSASPGILAIVLGVVLLATTIASKDEFVPYTGETQNDAVAASTDKATSARSQRCRRHLRYQGVLSLNDKGMQSDENDENDTRTLLVGAPGN